MSISFNNSLLTNENDIGILENWRVLDYQFVKIGNQYNEYSVVTSGGYPLGTLTNLTGNRTDSPHTKNPPYKKKDLIRGDKYNII